MKRLLVRGAVLVAAVVLTGCGFPVDDAPRALNVTTTTAAESQQATAEGGTGTAYLFYLLNNELTAVAVETTSRRPADVLRMLIENTAMTTSPNATSQIPQGTRLIDTALENGRLIVNISSEFDNLVGSGRVQALAQIVLTATDLTGVSTVALQIEGADVQIFSPLAGDTAVVSVCDFFELLPDAEALEQQDDLSRSQQHLLNRVVEADEDC